MTLLFVTEDFYHSNYGPALIVTPVSILTFQLDYEIHSQPIFNISPSSTIILLLPLLLFSFNVISPSNVTVSNSTSSIYHLRFHNLHLLHLKMSTQPFLLRLKPHLLLFFTPLFEARQLHHKLPQSTPCHIHRPLDHSVHFLHNPFLFFSCSLHGRLWIEVCVFVFWRVIKLSVFSLHRVSIKKAVK